MPEAFGYFAGLIAIPLIVALYALFAFLYKRIFSNKEQPTKKFSIGRVLFSVSFIVVTLILIQYFAAR